MYNVLISGSSDLGSSPDREHCVVPLSTQVYKWVQGSLKEHCQRSFSVFSFILCWNLYLVPYLLLPQMLKWTNRNISRMVAQRANHNEFLAIFSRNGSRIWKNWLVISNFKPFPSLPCKVRVSNKWFRCSDKVLGNKTASLFLGFFDAKTYFSIVKWC